MRKILFAIACAGLALISSAGASAQPAVYSTGVDGYYPAVSGDIIAFSTFEAFVKKDLNGDGDIIDWVLQYYNTSSGTLFNTGVANFLFDSPSISGNTIALAFSEGVAKKDLNGDGDIIDYLVMYYDIPAATLHNPGAIGLYPSISNNIITFTTQEGWIGEDLNGDGDFNDDIIMFYDISAETVYNTEIQGLFPSVDGNIIAFTTSESSVEQDLNGDGDTNDSVVRYYDISTGELFNTGAVAQSYNALTVSGSIITFYTYEWPIDQDLNGDGDWDDSVVRYYDIATAAVKSTASPWGVEPSVSGNIITFYTPEILAEQDLNGDGDFDDDIIMVYDISAGELRSTGAQGFTPAVSGDIIAAQTSEYRVGQDLNGDGDKHDYVITYLDLKKTDTDGDGIPDDTDNCPAVANPAQEDLDGDSLGDPCDPDDDNDGIPDDSDNCPAVANPGQEDSDGDTLGDPCDPDDDNDTIPDEIDNCPLTANQDQADNDGDGGGDVCDADDDNDGIADVDDICPYEDTTGLDADYDGCIDTIEGLISIINDQGLQAGIVNSLLSKVKNAAKSLGKGNDGAATNQLEAFINAIEAQKDKKIPASTADMLIAYANNLIGQISP